MYIEIYIIKKEIFTKKKEKQRELLKLERRKNSFVDVPDFVGQSSIMTSPFLFLFFGDKRTSPRD